MLSVQHKLCSFNCIYCQLGSTGRAAARRKEFVSLDRLAQELRALPRMDIDYATFSGMGEPTLASNLGEAIDVVRSNLDVPVAVITNSSLLPRQDVRDELLGADVVVAKLDTPEEALFYRINRPRIRCRLSEIIEGIGLFREAYHGKLAIDIMFVEDNRDRATEIARIMRKLSPDEVQINTPLRPCAVSPIPPEEIQAIRSHFSGLKRVVTVYEASPPVVSPLDMVDTARRRPQVAQLGE
jgi:wyosine [tRNA(Phe)-imidazoG37] synthetase (radical SAM superfamily)